MSYTDRWMDAAGQSPEPDPAAFIDPDTREVYDEWRALRTPVLCEVVLVSTRPLSKEGRALAKRLLSVFCVGAGRGRAVTGGYLR